MAGQPEFSGDTTYVKGQWNAECDTCGFVRKSGQMRKTWQGLWVCADTCWEPRHPRDSFQAKEDDQSIPWSRPESPDNS